jgi:hypothetical protein
LPAHEGLKADDVARREMHDGLVVDYELAARGCPSQIGFELGVEERDR